MSDRLLPGGGICSRRPGGAARAHALHRGVHRQEVIRLNRADAFRVAPADPWPAAGSGSKPYASPPDRVVRTPPDGELVTVLGRACGLRDPVAHPLPPGRSDRVWLLAERDGGRRPAPGRGIVLKLAPSAAEVAALEGLAGHAEALRLPAPLAVVGAGGTATVLDGLGRAAGEAEASPRAGRRGEPAALAMTLRPGRSLDLSLHAGAAIPLRALARCMAELHAASPPGGLPVELAPGEWLAERLPGWWRDGPRWGAADLGAVLPVAFNRLQVLAAGAPPPEAVLTHGDWAPRHVLVERGAVTGLVDWAGTRVADPARDVASAVTGLFAEGLSARAALALGADLAALYAAESGRALGAFAFRLLAAVTERTIGALRDRGSGRDSGTAAAWGGLLALGLEQAGRPRP